MYSSVMPTRENPTTARPMTEPAKKPTGKALRSPPRAAQATRAFARVETYMPA